MTLATRLHFVDASSAVVLALQEAFAEHQDVTVQHGDILTLAHSAIVSPANSHGFMDGGIDQQYAAFFEKVVQTRSRQCDHDQRATCLWAPVWWCQRTTRGSPTSSWRRRCLRQALWKRQTPTARFALYSGSTDPTQHWTATSSARDLRH